ncbi:vacuolar-processing enzyme [Elysia marginata]|uniref:Hemoglobinase n=1 Tax=Elysia marginata TaxID=1093978 RepID=A0AAV4GVC0_9GAST|nr:vacuolar-processing enzyme [Elysia marginata]
MVDLTYLKSIGLVLLVVVTAVVVVHADGDGDDEGVHWAVLVAGSNTYDNYRHQADICHAYHIVRKNGIPDDRIIVMMYDDIAHNPLNPFQGNIINQPNGTNLYPGVPKDYTKQEVRPEVFTKILTGDEEGLEKIIGRKGKVLKSGPKDYVFINFADHGGPGVFLFPHDGLYSDDFHKAVLEMHEKKMYKQMLFYVEACESGSMFFNFTQLSEINVFATTSASPDEPSHGCYYDDVRKTFLGDVYSVNWMQDSDKENLKKETLAQQFKLVKSKTWGFSHVSEYGDLNISKKPVADFLGTLNSDSNSKPYHFHSGSTAPDPRLDAVPAEKVKEEILLRKIAQLTGDEREQHKTELGKLWQIKKATEEFFRFIVGDVIQESLFEHFVKQPIKLSDFPCYKQSVKLIMRLCPGLDVPQNYYAVRKLRVLANLCDSTISAEQIWRSIGQVASRSKICA